MAACSSCCGFWVGCAATLLAWLFGGRPVRCEALLGWVGWLLGACFVGEQLCWRVFDVSIPIDSAVGRYLWGVIAGATLAIPLACGAGRRIWRERQETPRWRVRSASHSVPGGGNCRICERGRVGEVGRPFRARWGNYRCSSRNVLRHGVATATVGVEANTTSRLVRERSGGGSDSVVSNSWAQQRAPLGVAFTIEASQEVGIQLGLHRASIDPQPASSLFVVVGL